MDIIDKAFNFGYLYGLTLSAIAVLGAYALSLPGWTPLLVIGSAFATQVVISVCRAR